jgi:hypothetical protein
MTRHPVWYVPDSPAASLLTGLPADFERRPLADLTLLAGADPPGVLVVDAAGGEASALARAAAEGAGTPVVALVDAPVPDMVPAPPCYAYLSSSVSPPMLAAVLREACTGGVRAETRETDTQLEELTAIGIRLSAERDLDALLELILTKGREITRSDAGSLYVVEKDPGRQPVPCASRWRRTTACGCRSASSPSPSARRASPATSPSRRDPAYRRRVRPASGVTVPHQYGVRREHRLPDHVDAGGAHEDLGGRSHRRPPAH